MTVPAWLLGPALLVGGLAGAMLRPEAAPTPRAAPAAIERAERAELRRVVAEECRRSVTTVVAAVAPTRPEPEPEPEPAAPTREQQEAFGQAQTLLASALSAGQWTETDVGAMRDLMPGLSADQREAITSTLFPALNEGRLHTDILGMPL